jgi:hypothetical protein
MKREREEEEEGRERKRPRTDETSLVIHKKVNDFLSSLLKESKKKIPERERRKEF